MSNTFSGIFPALVTPMSMDEEPDYRRLADFTNYLIECGVHGLIPLGSTGEYYALSPTEREAVTKTTIEAAAGRVPVVIGTNAGSTREVIEFSQQAETLGADGVLLAAPYYSLPTPDELFEHFNAVNDAIGIPIMLYNYPGRTGVDMTPDLIDRLAELENIRYVKESTGDATRVSEIIRRSGDKIQVFCGCDTLALESLLMGAVGWVGGVVNVVPREHVRLFELASEEGGFVSAREYYFRMLPVLSLIEGGGKYTQFVKAGCELTGHPVGPPRRPLQPASSAEIESLRQVLGSLQSIQNGE
ncbi:4-hydroxy-tetrahydrodipicolinate synthase [Planctomycetes bacterium CA13]|uniref:4-hydroxy-tetrahydrodipicolinate synthase n=1 Tax=Novipirellula herctigrandis TaxID=2527986 RepID=A0A5C5YWJ3_9BACT|nr:4-hydroxy-tetrahydrodipicolinate synthase [Planctomycetes bacterium CA13]